MKFNCKCLKPSFSNKKYSYWENRRTTSDEKDKKENFFLNKKFNFNNFTESQKFINKVGKISEDEGHHPEISFGWGYAEIKITTHAIEGLSENDFILAAKIDQLTNA